ncbi:MAG: zinc ribbon domain-containing protein [Terrimicrobiaceae bacterium]
MPTYIYETIPAKAGAKPKRYEIRQSIKDPAFENHPETGEPVRRVIAGGIGVLTSGSASASSSSGGHCHNSSCGCG